MKSKKNYLNILMKVLWVGVILACIKSIFVDTGYDNGYSVAMAYRHINGDAMFTKMWEPHQTSVFTVELLMRIYHLFVPSYTGVVLFLQLCGVLINSGISFLLYKLISDISGKTTANFACMFYLVFNVKQSPFPDYAAMQITFSVLVFICLVKYLKSQKVLFLILSALSLCLEVLAYPSCVISYIAVFIILICFSKTRLKDIMIFTGVCALTGISYAGYFICRMGLDTLLTMANNILMADTHSVDPKWYNSYFQGMPVIVIWLSVSLVSAALLGLIIRKTVDNPVSFLSLFGICGVIYELAIQIIQKKIGTDFYCSIFIIPVLLMIYSVWGYRSLSSDEKLFWLSGVLISVSSFFATQLLSDLSLITILAYLVLGGVVSFIPISHMKKETAGFFICVCACVIIHRGLVVWGYGNKWGVNLVYEVENVVRSGPSAGVVCDYMTYYMSKENIRDHSLYVNEDDKFMLVDNWVFDPIEYLLVPGEISNPTTIDTPVYTENTLEYFKYNPDKIPTVVCISCWYGTPNIDADSMIMKWIDQNYHQAGEGSYWRYYRIN